MNDDLEVAHPQSGSSPTLFLVELEFGNVAFCRERKTGVPGEKCLGAKERTHKKLNLHMASTPGFEPRPHSVEGERSYLCAIPCYRLPCNWTVRAIARAHRIKWIFFFNCWEKKLSEILV